jgi:hypothetical protein
MEVCSRAVGRVACEPPQAQTVEWERAERRRERERTGRSETVVRPQAVHVRRW